MRQGDTSTSCGGCGHANRAGARFCESCGATVQALCPACGHELRETARFCDACGAPVAEAAGETRKTVTVVFADLVASTTLQETLDPESVRHVMGRFYAAMQAAIERHGGRVEKFVGDAAMGVFGVPIVREDDALRATRAALDMVAGLDALNDGLERDWGVRLGMRTGVNTGEIVVGPAGFLVGDPVNVAARLEQAAAPGQVLVGETTARLVRHAITLDPVAPLAAKGKSDALIAYALVTSGEAVAVAARVEVPLVGRAAELGRLRDVFADAVAARACRLATVIGSPGVGKTRLARALADGVAGEAIVVEGRCEPQGEGITFLPVADVLRDAAGIDEADAPGAVREKLGAILAGEPEAERIVERTAGVLGLVAPASAEETFWAVRRMLECLARRRPLLVVLDDIHWGEPQFLDLIEHLVYWSVDAPILIVALARPELREHHDALTRQGTVASAVIDVEPLGDNDSLELMSSLIEGARLPDALVARVLNTTGGNPLFLGETIRMLVDDGIVRRGSDDAIEVDLATIDVPPTIAALLEARIERLGADERSVVERAAVIGKQFYRGAVAELSSAPVASQVDEHLETLRLKEMVEPDGTYWIDEPVFRFHHVLIRDAAYRALLKEARSELHERFAQWLEEKAGELVGEHEEVIAFHLEQAHEYRRELGPLDDHGRALGAQAAARLRSAGQRALDRDDLAAAANLLGRALNRIEPSHAAARAEVLLDLAEALIATGDTIAAGEVVAQLRALAGADARFAARADVLAGQLDILTGAGGVGATIATVRAAADVLAATGDGAGEAKGHHVIAQAEALLGQVGAVEEALDRALAAARRAEDRRRVTAVLAAAPRAALWGPSPVVRASGRCLDVVRILRMTPGNRHVEAIALRCQAVLEAMRGRTDAAREILDAGRTTLEELGLTLELQETAIHAGIVELLAGDPGAAEQHLRGAAGGFAALGVDLGRAQASALLARALVEQGRHDEAIAATKDAEEHGGGDLKTTITWCGGRAEALAHSGDLEVALELAERAVDLAEPTDALSDKADASMALARVLAAAGRDADAQAAAAHARELYAAKEHSAGVLRAAALAGGEPTHVEPRAEPDDAEIGDLELRRFFEHYHGCYAARDVDGVVAMAHADYVMVDNRKVGWDDVHGLEDIELAARTMMGASYDLRPHIEEVHAAGDGVIAMRLAWRGTSSETGGSAVVPVGYVAVIRDGKLRRTELYEPEDRAAMLARFAELTGGAAPVLGDKPPERYYAEWARRMDAQDVDGMLELLAEDWVVADHRALAWDEQGGHQQGRSLFESVFSIAPDMTMHIDDVLACDERVIALRVRYQGHSIDGSGEFAIPVGYVTIVEDGLAVRTDMYEVDDVQAILARFAELTGEAPSALGDTAPERLYAAWCRCFNARDLDALVRLYGPDWVITDHRTLGWTEQRGLDAARSLVESAFAMSSDLTSAVDEVLACDERVIALRLTYRGHASDGAGELAIEVGHVTLVENGLTVSIDQYEPDDVQAMIARFAELGGRLPVVLGDRPPERVLRAYLERFAARDVKGAIALARKDAVIVDRRRLGLDTVDTDNVEATLDSMLVMWPDVRFDLDEVVACDDRVIAFRATSRGTSAVGGGAATTPLGVVWLVEDGLITGGDVYEHEDSAAMIARYAELGGGQGPLGDRPPERFWKRFARAYAARDEAVGDLYDDDWEFVDHRELPWDPTGGRDGAMALVRSGWEVMDHIRLEIDEVLTCDERVIAMRGSWSGGGTGGSGEMALPIGIVGVVEGGRLMRSEFFDAEDRGAMLACVAELTR